MSSLRPESHVAQQIRRGKLRVHNSSSQHLQDFPHNNLEQLPLHPGFNLDLLQVRNVRNANMPDEPAVYSSSEMANFPNPLSAPRTYTLEYQEVGAAEPSRLMMHQYSSFPHSSANIHSSPKEQCELRNLGNWRNSAPHQVDWIVNYASSSMANERNQNSFVASELNDVSAYQHYGKPSYNELTDVQSSSLSREIQKQLGIMHHPSSSSYPLYQNALQDIVKSASISANNVSDMASLMHQTGHNIWVGDASQLELQPSCGNQPNQLRFGSGYLWTNRTIDSTFRWNSYLGFTDKKVDEDSRPLLSDSNPQSLSLSLSSNAQSKPCVSRFEEGSATASDRDLQSGCGISKDPQCLKDVKSIVKPSIISRDCGKSSLQDDVGIPLSTTTYRNVGPLGPFTGYATILKSSRFIKSAQQLLDEFCCLSTPKFAKACDVSERASGEVSASTSADAVTVNETEGVAANGSNSVSSACMLYRANENSSDRGGGGSFCLSHRPDYQQKKAKLLYMQEEVARRYKQYHQQMQMVVSSFEAVAGLSSATPYIALAIKSVSRHFRCLKNSISDQIKLISEILGEDLSVPTTVSPSSKVDTNMEGLGCMEQSIQKNKAGGGNTGLPEPQQHLWRPQRGLPERSVAILKAWLFEHFLHPYPTDTDKHMLATQTGLSRNQVSNWFINARVRVWKPMVEEIHMLETKGITGANQNSSNNEGTSGTEGGANQTRVDKPLSKFGMHLITESQFQCMEMGSSRAGNNAGEIKLNEEQWSQEKRSKLECQMTSSSMDETLMRVVPYQRGGLEVGGLGSVSLTLGLRHGVEGVQNQQQLQEEQFRRHFGGHIYDP